MSKKIAATDLNLLEAVIRWCDTELIEAARRAEAACAVTALANYHGPRLLRDSELRPGTAHDWMVRPVRPHQYLDAAWEQIRRHWCLRIEAGEFIVSGYKLAFSGNPAREVLPGIFATAMTFKFADNQIEFDGRTYTHVLVTPAERDVSQCNPRPTTDAVVDDAAVGTDALDLVVVKAKKARGGRPSCRPLIMEAARDKWDAIDRDGQPAASWKSVAVRLHKHLNSKYQNLSPRVKIPDPESIRTRLPKIYREILKERECSKSI